MTSFEGARWVVQMLFWLALILAAIAIVLTARTILSSEAWDDRKRQVETESQPARVPSAGTSKKAA